MCCGQTKWNMEKRYNEFSDLHDSLKALHAHVPNFPPKTYFKLKHDKDVDDRRENLARFMKDIANRTDMRSSKAFRNFCDLDEKIIGSRSFSPIKISEVSDLIQGGRDFVFIEERNLLFVAMSEMKITNRLDSYLTNVSPH